VCKYPQLKLCHHKIVHIYSLNIVSVDTIASMHKKGIMKESK